MPRITLLFFFISIIHARSFAQPDAYTGTWQMEYSNGGATIYIELQIAHSEKKILYPAHILLQCDSFKAEYDLLLVKRNSRELGISKNKYPVSEKPFSLGNRTFFLNGIFDYSKDRKGIPILNLRRIQSKQYVTSPESFDKASRLTANRLGSFLKDAEIILKKINELPWKGENSERMLDPALSHAYFGLMDTIHFPVRYGTFGLTGNKKKGNDIVSVVLNGSIILDQVMINKKKYTDELLLDTGLNIITLFADNFGNALPNKGMMNLAFANKKYTLDFNNKEDSGASFIAAKIYFTHDKSKETYFQNNNTAGQERTLQKNEKLLGSIISNSPHLTLGIWDDAVEDGDSISININGKWITRGFPVKKKPQFINITLKPGTNTITFIPDNLGSIPPNTSVLEIIDGNKRKSFFMETSLGENNLVKIFYEVKN